ncbi:sigma-54-dependent transcriptional regulator [Falsihalocynthiibacter sp. BN13B15]|uniref:sigma-54-dependent transcriptional regulator n=1 Tax=Falsihalocynthiibacter sp. BN13B15 TaxID=3240871 RepID=UPI003510121E
MISRVLLVDDDAHVREALGQTLALNDLVPTLAASFIEAKDHISAGFQGVILSDIRMPGKDGFHLLEYTQNIDPDLPVILLTGEGDVPMAVRGISAGAFDFIEKPCAPQDLVLAVQKALRTRSLVLENRRLKQQLEKGDAAERMLFGQSKPADELRNRVRIVAATNADVLIAGVTGSGTSKVAEVIHLLSNVAMSTFDKIAASELSVDALEGALAQAKDGSLFIDGIASLPPATQFALLQHMELGTGARILAGTYKDLSEYVEHGRFNEELFFLLDVMRVRIPSLRERPEDIPVLFRNYVLLACEQAALPVPEITPEVIARLMAQEWPGNARALMNAAMRFAMGFAEVEVADDLGLAEQLSRVERSLLTEALRKHKGNASEVARVLKLPRKTLYDKLTRHGIRAEVYR